MSAIGWKFRRLRAMRPSEIVSRVRTQARMQWDRIVGEAMRPSRRLARLGALKTHTSKPWLEKWPTQLNPQGYVERASEVQGGHVRLFGQSFELGIRPNWNTDPWSRNQLPASYGPLMSLRDPTLVGSIKHLWELNRHACLTELAQAWRLTGDTGFLRAFEERLGSWLEQCPPRRGPNWHSAHEAAMRLINWTLSWHLLGMSDSTVERASFASVDFLRAWESSAIEHMLFISEFLSRGSSANNHLFGEFAGLYVGTLTWDGWVGTDRLAEFSQKGLEQESLQQIFADGVGAEQAPWYLHELCDMLGFCIVLGNANGKNFASETLDRLQSGLDFLQALSSFSDPPLSIGDSDDAIPIPLGCVGLGEAWKAVVQAYSVSSAASDPATQSDKVCWLRDVGKHECSTIDTKAPSSEITRSFSDGGYLLARRTVQARGRADSTSLGLLLDVGDLGYLSIAAHGHADALSLCMSIDGRAFLVDPGTFSYRPNDFWRDWFRGTSAHNTVCIDKQDQSLMSGPFMWSKHARAELLVNDQTEGSLIWKASHYGYERLADPVIHSRTVVWCKPWSELRVVDSFQCRSSHRLCWSWQFAPDWTIHLEGDQARLSSREKIVVVSLPSGAQFDAQTGLDRPEGGWVSSRFFEKTEAPRLTAIITSAGPATFTTTFRLVD